MKKILSSLAMLVLGLGLNAQVDIGSGATGSTNIAIPVECYYGYTYSQMIYTAAEINASGTITSLKFYKSGTGLANSSDWTVYLGHTSTSTFATTTSWEAVSGLTQVFSDSVVQVGNEVTVTLTTPFVYNGVDNLVIAVDENQSSYDGSSDDFYCSARAGNTAITYRDDSNNPDPASPPTATYLQSYIANVELGGITQTCPTLSGLAANNIGSTSADLDWTAGSGATTEVEYGTSGFTLGTGTASTVTTNTLNVSTLSAITSYDFYVRDICGAGDTASWAGPFAFTTLCAVYTPTFTEDFTNYLPGCWEEFQGVLGATNTIVTNATSSSWVADGFANSGSTGSARMEIWSTGKDEWLVSPSIDLGTGAVAYQVDFDAALTYYSTTAADVLGADDTLAIVISTDNGVTWNTSNILKVWTAGSEPSASGDYTAISLAAYTGVVKFGFYAASSVSGGDVNVYIDNFEVKPIPSCSQPLNLSISNLTSTSADASWTLAAANSVVEYGASGFTLGSGTTMASTTGSVSITGLMSNSPYEFYVMDSCGVGNVSGWSGPFSFTTDCQIYTPTYLEDFATYTFSVLPTCWEEAQGVLGATSTSFTATSSNWTSDGFANNGSSGSARMEIYSTGRDEWLMTPSIDLGTGTVAYQVDFDAALTYWSTTAAGVLDADDTLALVISTDNGVTWNTSNILKSWTAGSEPSALGDYVVVDLAAYTGIVKFGFYAASSVSGGDVNVYIDNFQVRPVPACPQPLNLSISNLTTTSVDVNWTVGAANSIVEYGMSGFSLGTGTSVASTTGSAPLTGLTSNSSYEFYVMDSCGISDVSAWSGPFSFYTGYCTPAPSSQDGDGITNVTLGTINNTTGSEAGFYGDYSSMSSDVLQGVTQTIDITFSTGYSYGTKIWIDWNNDLVFDNATELVYTGLSGAANPSTLNASFVIPPMTAIGSYTVRIGGTDNDSGPSGPCYSSSYGSFEDYSINVIAPCSVTFTDVQTVCDAFTWTDGSIFTASNNTATYTVISSVAGICDSVYVLDLTLNVVTSSSITEVSCGTYTAPSGNTYNSTGTYYDTIVNSNGCDSVITIDLTVNNTFSNLTEVVCDQYTAPSGNVLDSTGIFTDTILNTAGCDSIITIDLTVNYSQNITIFGLGCDVYTSPSGVDYNASGTYTELFTTPAGCDSTVYVEVTISNSYDIDLDVTGCESYISDGGVTYTTDGIYSEVFTSIAGCDSVINYNVTITNTDLNITQNQGVLLTSDENGAGVTYQWLDCNDNNAPIAGATGQTYTATLNGDYACEITKNTCVSITACYTVSNVSVNNINSSISIYPNPSNGLITIEIENLNEFNQFKVIDLSGKVVFESNINSNKTNVDLVGLSKGVYLIQLVNEKEVQTKQLIIE